MAGIEQGLKHKTVNIGGSISTRGNEMFSIFSYLLW